MNLHSLLLDALVWQGLTAATDHSVTLVSSPEGWCLLPGSVSK